MEVVELEGTGSSSEDSWGSPLIEVEIWEENESYSDILRNNQEGEWIDAVINLTEISMIRSIKNNPDECIVVLNGEKIRVNLPYSDLVAGWFVVTNC